MGRVRLLGCGSVGKGCSVYGRVRIEYRSRLRIGQACTLNHNVHINARGLVTIGDNVRISAGVIIQSAGLAIENKDQPYEHYLKPVIIEDGVWLAAGAIIQPGVRIGKNAVVAAGAVVAKDVSPHSLVGGVPACLIKQLQS